MRQNHGELRALKFTDNPLLKANNMFISQSLLCTAWND